MLCFNLYFYLIAYIQFYEKATIHSLVPPHPNVVTLHRTLETPSFLLLILEFVPGEDLFYFLKQARDQYCLSPEGGDDCNNPINGLSGNGVDLNGSENVNGNGPGADIDGDGEDESNRSGCSSRTPPTPSLLATFNAGQLLSKTRLRLIASMFGQVKFLSLNVFSILYQRIDLLIYFVCV